MPKPLNHPEDPNKIIFAPDFEQGEIFQFDLSSNVAVSLQSYEDQIGNNPESHGIFMDPQNKTLTIYGGDPGGINESCYITFNWRTMKMTYDDDNILSNSSYTTPSSCYIEDKHQLHIVYGGNGQSTEI